MRTMKKITGLFILLIFSSMGAFAQTEDVVSDTELKQFASALQKVQHVEQKTQEDLVTAVQEKGLDVQRFNELQQAKQDPSQEADATDEELEKFEAATKELGKIQMTAQQKMQEKITAEGLTVPRYQEISAAIQNDPELQQKVREFMQG